LLEWLLKYPPHWYARGSVDIDWSWPVYGLAVAAAVLLLLLVGGYRRLRRGMLSWLLRGALAAVLLLALARPSLVVEAPEPVPGHVAVLLDDSLSMRLPDAGGTSAAQRLQSLLERGGEPFGFEPGTDVRRFRFGDGVQPLAPGEVLGHGDARSELGAALLRAATGHDADSLASVVLVSDGGGMPGADARARLDQALLALRAAEVPVHVVAVAGDTDAPDLELTSLRMPRQALLRDAFDVELTLGWHDLGGERTRLVIEDDGVIVHRSEITLPEQGEQMMVRRRLSFDDAGTRLLTARVEPLGGETNRDNNRLERSIDIRDAPIRVLHFEGEPRFEVKFVRRAVAEDPIIRLASLLRTADNKYYRLGVEDPSQLANGFPDSTAELFEYDVLILGSVEASLLEPEQWQAIHDFVDRRGGGLLMLGGNGAFAEGGHQASLLAPLLPVWLSAGAGAFRAEVHVQPTAAGRADPLLDFANADLFERLPPLTVVNPHYQAKPGATVLLEGDDAPDRPLIVLASQNYGRGRVMSFAVTNSWRWQMSVPNPLQDQTHEQLWRALLRDLGRQAEARVELSLSEAVTTPGQPVSVRAQALDREYRPQPDASLTLEVTTPLGAVERHPMARAEAGDGHYTAQFVPVHAGRYELSVALADGGETTAAASEYVDVSVSGREFHGRSDGRRVLERIAAATGGSLVDATDAADLAGVVDDSRGSRTVLRELPLWNAPILLLAALLLACADWALRRRRDLA
jgi:uncharacterized membrane protein